jgi:hypothetical protein
LTRKRKHDGGFDHAETVDAYPRLSNADLDRIDAQRRQRRQHHALRAIVVPAGAAILLAAVGVVGWRVTIYDSAHQAAASVRPASRRASAPSADHRSTAARASAAAAPSSSPSPPAAAIPAFIYGCEGQPVTEPDAYTLACADGNAGLSGLTWSTWTAASATGSGQYYQNTCVPDCAGGTFVYTPVTVTLSDPLATADGGEYFTMMTVPGKGAWQLGPEGPDGFQGSS